MLKMFVKIRCWVCAVLTSLLHWVKKYPSEALSALLVIVTLLLVLVTYLYLVETRKQRLLMQKAVSIDTAPKVFIEAIEATARPNYDGNEIIIHSAIQLKNCGGTEAKNIKWSYVITFEGKEKTKENGGPYQYLYPDQVASMPIKKFKFSISNEAMKTVKQAVELKKPVIVPENYIKPVLLDIEIMFDDLDGNTTKTPYSYKYLFSMNKWVVPEQH